MSRGKHAGGNWPTLEEEVYVCKYRQNQAIDTLRRQPPNPTPPSPSETKNRDQKDAPLCFRISTVITPAPSDKTEYSLTRYLPAELVFQSYPLQIRHFPGKWKQLFLPEVLQVLRSSLNHSTFHPQEAPGRPCHKRPEYIRGIIHSSQNFVNFDSNSTNALAFKSSMRNMSVTE
ncbi:hypothetical protein I7I51_02140 [Histoplasma capsulatum]|uniref:Uncharacterized protein n=1 Tax=Ajellomyces capsulatus TaxID=5037 RepID=A0A8A1MCF6_AJECA|nr:hypothetical protein I7I51_02140 [Histoplasma capsulatum]